MRRLSNSRKGEASGSLGEVAIGISRHRDPIALRMAVKFCQGLLERS